MLILELPLLNAQSSTLIRELITESGATRVIVAYRFGSRKEIEELSPHGLLVVRSPDRIDELFELAAASTEINRARVSENEAHTRETTPEIPEKLFTESELIRLSIVNSTIGCECPHQLVELVTSLNAFEDYSANCESLGEKDAHIHAYLHQVTAKVRATMEQALEKLSIAEGLIPPRDRSN